MRGALGLVVVVFGLFVQERTALANKPTAIEEDRKLTAIHRVVGPTSGKPLITDTYVTGEKSSSTSSRPKSLVATLRGQTETVSAPSPVVAERTRLPESGAGAPARGTAELKGDSGGAPAVNTDVGATPPPPAKDPQEDPLLKDPDLVRATKAAALRELQRQVEEYDEMKSVLMWNNYLGRGIFLVVHGILAMALVISWREFQAARETRALAKARTKGTRQSHEEHAEQEEVSASLEGIALKTSRHGTLILLVAFAFYVAYLKFVYPIQIIPG